MDCAFMCHIHLGTINNVRTNLVVFALLSSVQLLGAANRIPDVVDPAKATVLKGRVHPLARAEFDRGAVEPGRVLRYASIYFKPTPGLGEFLAEQQTPGSPNFHKWLTPEQFGDRFGISVSDAAKVTAWMKSRGLQVHDIARGRQWITFSGTVAQISAALKTEFRQFEVDGGMHFATASDPFVPSALAQVVSGFGGLDDFEPKDMHIVLPEPPDSLGRFQPRETTGTTHYLAPDDLAAIYNITPLYQSGIDGTGQKIAVIGRSNISLADIRSFRTRFGLPPNDPQVVLFGPDPGTTSAQGEADLDLEVAGAIARNATIIYVNSTSVLVSAQYAVDQNLAPVMTYSYGSCELSVADNQRAIAQQANAQGITWLASSGDWGAATCDYTAPTPQATKGLTVSYPASIPEITAVGGTQFDDTSGTWWSAANGPTRASALGYIPERGWSESSLLNRLAAGGGGASALYSKPVWQTGSGVPNDNARDVPDVSFSAAVHDGYEIISAGSILHVGGTSASSPAFAGMLALLNQSIAIQDPKAAGLGNINPSLYRMAQSANGVFHDTVVGDNKVPCSQGSPGCVEGQLGFTAAPGYDLATGLGSMDFAQFVAKWSSTANSTTTLTASPDSYSLTDTITLTATVSGAGALPTGTVKFIGNDVVLGTANLVAADKVSTATISVGGNTVAPGNGKISATYSGDGNFSASAGTASVALKLPSNGSLVLLTVNPSPVRAAGPIWPYLISISEKAGVATTITAYTVNGVNNLAGLPTTKLAANATVEFSSFGSGLSVPLDRTYHLEGMDADGTTWKRDLVVSFLPAVTATLTTGMNLSATPTTIQRNPQADPSCPWQQQIMLRETGGDLMVLSALTVGGTSLTSQISTIFGTTRLPPWGMLTGTVCYSANAPAQTSVSVSAASYFYGITYSASVSTTLASAAVSPSAFSVSVPSITLPAAVPGDVATGSVDLKFAAGNPLWKAGLVYPGLPKWLKVSATSGTGPATVSVQADSSGLSTGVYNALLSIEATDCIPQVIQIPVALVVGKSDDISITGLGNAASGVQAFAPGQLVAVYGTGLVSALKIAATQPLPLSLNGTTATVNGIAAPLWFVSPSQINLQIPYETSVGPAVLAINNGGKLASYNFTVQSTAPGIFTDLSKNMVPVSSGAPGQTIYGFITGDGEVNSLLFTGATNTSSSSFPKSRQALSMTVGGLPATVVFNGIVPGLIGVTQVNFTIPADIQPGIQPVVVRVGTIDSAPANITVTAK